MISSLVRIFETRSFKPLKFSSVNRDFVDIDVDDIGIYIHIPFCKVLCSFCPYYKIKYNEELIKRYKDALIKEIKLIGTKYKDSKITSIYFGGGTPSLMIDCLYDIISEIKAIFHVNCDIGIELHPRDINVELGTKLKDIGFTMVSIGVQSFRKEELETLGRDYIDGREKVKIIKEVGFNVIDVDLIFGIKGQTVEDLRIDFTTAFEVGATQVSTYPFIDFSYASNKHEPLKTKDKKELLLMLEELSKNMGLNRTSVWTFGIKGKSKYSSVTRDTYIGFGPSAASLTKKYFKVNTFSVEEYIKSVEKGENPKSLTLDFSERVRALYWIFWNAYTLDLHRKDFKKIFNKEIEELFRFELWIAQSLRIIKKKDDKYTLTKKGTYIYHLLEQHYTHEYIDKTWNVCSKNPWPSEINLY